MTIGEKLTALRTAKGWSQVEFCQVFSRRYPQLALKRSRYSKWETDENMIGVHELKAVVTLYRITADELIFDHLKLPGTAKKQRLKIA